MKLKKNKKYKKGYRQSKMKVKLPLKDKLKNLSNKQKILVNMRLHDGDTEQFIVKIDDNNTFTYKNGKYIVVEKFLHYNRSFKLWEANYHQDISIPVLYDIDPIEIKKYLDNPKVVDKDVIECLSNIEPLVLKTFSDSKVIIDSIQGHAISQIMGFIKIMLIIILIGVGISLFILVGGSGIF